MKIQKRLAVLALVLSINFHVQAQVSHIYVRALAANVIMPQARPVAAHSLGEVQVTGVDVGVEIIEQVATTTLDISLLNPSATRIEAEMVAPVPDQAVLRGFSFQGAAAEPKAELLTKEEARSVYDSIVAKIRDPALLEFVGFNLIRSSVFPVEAHGTQKVRLVYEHLLTADGDRLDYLLPRSESLDYKVPWNITVKIKSKAPIGTVYSPSHRLDVERSGEGLITARVASGATTEPGPFRLCYLLQRDGITASLLAYPDPKVGGGYFLLLASAPAKAPRAGAVKRELVLVLDRSGSMAGEKLEQVRAAALQTLEGLDEGERFNIILYSDSVESFAPEPVVKSAETMRAARAYLRGVTVRGGTNIHDALLEALRMKPAEGFLPLVLFLTDGLPTVGQTSEKAIREVVNQGNPYERRIFTFGVGVDVNTPLLDKLALDTRATATFVMPKEDVEVKVGQVFKRLVGPVLAAPKLAVREADGGAAPGRVRDLMPSKIPDLFEGDQLVVLGQYVGEDPLNFALTGNYFGKQRTFKFKFALDKSTTRNAFVPRLWASRKIAALTDAIRDLGADRNPASAVNDPRAKELVEDIVRLSKEYGILSEYTAFLAREGTDLSRPATLLTEAQQNFNTRAINTRVGYAAVNQEFNNDFVRSQSYVNVRNAYLDQNLNRVEVGNVQQVNDRAFYKRGNQWVDSALVSQSAVTPQKVVTIGSEEFNQLVHRLAEQGRAGTIALNGEILLQVDGETVLVK